MLSSEMKISGMSSGPKYSLYTLNKDESLTNADTQHFLYTLYLGKADEALQQLTKNPKGINIEANLYVNTNEHTPQSLLHNNSGLWGVYEDDPSEEVEANYQTYRTPLMLAVSHSNVDLVRLLIQRGLDPNFKLGIRYSSNDIDLGLYDTAFEMAVSIGDQEIIDSLQPKLMSSAPAAVLMRGTREGQVAAANPRPETTWRTDNLANII